MDQNLRINLCQNICAYFKPARKESIACEGFIVIERLLGKGTPVVFDKPDNRYAYGVQKMLMQDICTVCPFYRDDCDFILAEPSPQFGREEREKPLPCGGFMLLAHLLENKIIKIDDIRNIL